MDAEAEFLDFLQGRGAAEMPGPYAILHQKSLPQTESFFFAARDTGNT